MNNYRVVDQGANANPITHPYVVCGIGPIRHFSDREDAEKHAELMNEGLTDQQALERAAESDKQRLSEENGQ